MTPDLPAKGAPDASFAAKACDRPTKPILEDEQGAADVRDERAGFPAKPPLDTAATEENAPKVQKGEREPPHYPTQVHDQHRPEPGGEQYLRLTIRVDDGALSIVDGHLVAGPLAQATTLQGGHAYEVTAGDRVLHIGGIPDLGTFRSFAHPKGTLEQRRHHSYRLPTYEFDARVALSDLRGIDPAGVAVTLYRVKQPDAVGAPSAALDTRSFRGEREQQLREVGRVIGIPLSALPDEFTTNAPSDNLRRPGIRKSRRPIEDSDGDTTD